MASSGEKYVLPEGLRLSTDADNNTIIYRNILEKNWRIEKKFEMSSSYSSIKDI